MNLRRHDNSETTESKTIYPVPQKIEPSTRPGWLKRPVAWLVVFAVIGIGAAAYFRTRPNVQQSSPPVFQVRTAEVRSGTLEQSIRVTGTTVSTHGAQLRAPFLRGQRSRGGGSDFGLTLTDLVEPGSTVKPGDVLAVFDNVRMRDRLSDLQAERVDLEGRIRKLLANRGVTRETHDQDVRRAKAALDSARLDLKTAPVLPAIRAEMFRLTSAENQEVYESLNAQTQYLDIAEDAEIRSLEHTMDSARAEERRAELNLERMTVRAPVGGLVVMQQIIRNGEPAQVRNGDSLGPGQPYLQIVDASSLIVQAAASQVDVAKLRIGSPAHLEFDAYPGVKAKGKVKLIGSLATGSRFRRSYFAQLPVTITIDNLDEHVIPGLSASADIVLAKETDATIIPRGAIFEQDKQPYAFIRRSSGWEKCSLELGLTNNVAAAVRSGVSEGEVVALEQPAKWSDCLETNTTQRQTGSSDSGS